MLLYEKAELAKMKLAELAVLYVLAMRYPLLIDVVAHEIQSAMERLAGNEATIAAIREMREAIDNSGV